VGEWDTEALGETEGVGRLEVVVLVEGDSEFGCEEVREARGEADGRAVRVGEEVALGEKREVEVVEWEGVGERVAAAKEGVPVELPTPPPAPILLEEGVGVGVMVVESVPCLPLPPAAAPAVLSVGLGV